MLALECLQSARLFKRHKRVRMLYITVHFLDRPKKWYPSIKRFINIISNLATGFASYLARVHYTGGTTCHLYVYYVRDTYATRHPIKYREFNNILWFSDYASVVTYETYGLRFIIS